MSAADSRGGSACAPRNPGDGYLPRREVVTPPRAAGAFLVCEEHCPVNGGMRVPKQEKVEKVAELRARIEASEALFLADFRGLTVTESGELRRSLTEAGTRFSVVKNTLMRLAVADAGAQELQRLLEGPTAVAFVEADPV